MYLNSQNLHFKTVLFVETTKLFISNNVINTFVKFSDFMSRGWGGTVFAPFESCLGFLLRGGGGWFWMKLTAALSRQPYIDVTGQSLSSVASKTTEEIKKETPDTSFSDFEQSKKIRFKLGTDHYSPRGGIVISGRQEIFPSIEH